MLKSSLTTEPTQKPSSRSTLKPTDITELEFTKLEPTNITEPEPTKAEPTNITKPTPTETNTIVIVNLELNEFGVSPNIIEPEPTIVTAPQTTITTEPKPINTTKFEHTNHPVNSTEVTNKPSEHPTEIKCKSKLKHCILLQGLKYVLKLGIVVRITGMLYLSQSAILRNMVF